MLKFTFLRKFMCCRLLIASVHCFQESLWSIIRPRYLYSITTSISSPLILDRVVVVALSRLKSKSTYLVLDVFRIKCDASHQLTKSFRAGPCLTSSCSNRLSKAMSSTNLITWCPGYLLRQQSLFKIYSQGDSILPCGVPMEIKCTSDVVLLNLNLGGLPIRNTKRINSWFSMNLL